LSAPTQDERREVVRDEEIKGYVRVLAQYDAIMTRIGIDNDAVDLPLRELDSSPLSTTWILSPRPSTRTM
jgi:hypothetical protein